MTFNLGWMSSLLCQCGLSNNILDTNEAYYVVRGFQGDNLDEVICWDNV